MTSNMGSLFSSEEHTHSHGHGHSHGGAAHGHSHHGHSHEGVGNGYDQDFFEGEKAKEYDDMEETRRLVDVEYQFLKEMSWFPEDGASWTVLDFGCGPARLLTKLASIIGPGSAGFDVSEGMLELAKEKAQAVGLEEALSFVKLESKKNAEELEVYAGKSDLSMICFVLHHTIEPKIIFERYCRTVKPGGRLFVCEFETVLAQDTLKEWMQPFGFSIETSKNDTMTTPEWTIELKMTIAKRNESS